MRCAASVWIVALVLSGLFAGCSGPAIDMDPIAESYVKLVLAVGVHDEGYVDAYHGPEEWRTAASAEKRSLDDIRTDATSLLDQLAGGGTPPGEELVVLRHAFLTRQLEALVAYVDMLGGARMSFDEESQALYDAVAPSHPTSYFEEALAQLDRLLPGEGAIDVRLSEFRAQYVIPPERLDAVFTAAIDEARKRTLRYIDLPPDENFVVEYVADKPWSGYNWYQGNAHSLIQMNTDLPIYIDRAVDLACHEGYPGHHVYNVLLEEHLLRGRGWVEFSVYPLFSPMSLIAEGSANYGIDVAFPGEERIAYEKEVLFPLAGLDPATADRYYEVEEVLRAFKYAGNEAARAYLDGKLDKEETIEWLGRHAASSRDRAEQSVRFYDAYRSYVINYNLGLDMVRAYVEAQGGTADAPEKRWEIFTGLLASPRLPSGLR